MLVNKTKYNLLFKNTEILFFFFLSLVLLLLLSLNSQAYEFTLYQSL